MVNVKDRPVSLNSLVFSDKKGNSIVTEDYELTFANHKLCELFIQDRYEYWKNVLGMDLVFAQDDNETIKEVETQKVLEMVCEKLGTDYLKARSKSQVTKFVTARRYAMNIAHVRKVNKSTIGKALGVDRSTVIHHIKVLSDLCEFDREEKRMYLDLEDYVMINLNGQI